MLQAAIDAEVEAFIAMHADRTDERGRRLVVKNGSFRNERSSPVPGRSPSHRDEFATTIPIPVSASRSLRACCRATCERRRPSKN